MKIKSKSIHPDLHFRVLHTIEENPNVSQRQLANNLGISLGSVNYCLKALIEIGQIKVKNFNRSPSKSSYLYLLTPKGFSTKATLTSDFLKRKMAEYQKLKEEIDSIQLKSENEL
jgi:EPS-associated MarR family transcriptional regulator